MKNMHTLGQFVRTARIHRGIAARDLAAEVGVDAGTLSRMETGVMKTLPDPDLLDRLATALRVTRLDLLEAAGYLQPGDRTTVSANPFPPDDIRYRVVEAMKALDISGPEFAFWTGHFSMQLRMYRDIATYGLGHVDDEAETETPNYMVDRRARTGS